MRVLFITEMKLATVAGYITSTREQLRHLPGHLWAILFYCLQPRLDYWLRLLPTDITRSAAQAVDAALLSTVEAAGRPGMFAEDDGTPAEGVMLRRLRLPARRKGAGVRSRLELAPAAYCASAVEAMECFLPGAGSAGFWAVLEPVFGAGAFDAGGHRLEQWLDARTPEAMSFFLAWIRCQAEVRDTDVRGPRSTRSRVARASGARGGCSTRSPCSVSRLRISGSPT